MHSPLVDENAQMPQYRIYLISTHHLFTKPPILVDVETDAEAMMHASGVARTHVGAEVWLGTRLVCRVPNQALLDVHTASRVASMSSQAPLPRAVAGLEPAFRLAR
jgi:hypothetical protein